jgi:hypothetical protein
VESPNTKIAGTFIPEAAVLATTASSNHNQNAAIARRSMVMANFNDHPKKKLLIFASQSWQFILMKNEMEPGMLQLS